MDWWEPLVLIALGVYLFTWRGFGPLGQPHDPPFPIWPDIWRFNRDKLWSS